MARSNLSKEGRKVKRLTVRDKLVILDRLDRGERVCEIAKTAKLSQAVVSRIKKDRDKLRQIQKDNSPLLQSTHNLFKSKYPQLDQTVYDWFVEIRHPNGKRKPLPLSRRLTQSRAKVVANQLGITDFNASNGWFTRWLWRFNIGKSVKLHGEAADIDLIEAESKMSVIREQLADAGYKPENVFNMDETGLYYRCLPDRSYILTSGDERQIGRGTKAMKAKDRLTLVLCFNATGTCKISPSLVGTSKQPQCFRGGKKFRLVEGATPQRG
jgi:hypothetical protein